MPEVRSDREGGALMSDEKLRPCPFCGGEAEISHVRDICRDPQDWYWGKCHSCHISGSHYPTEAEAIAAWNTRAERTCHAELNESRTAVVCSECGSSDLLRGWEEMHDWERTARISTFTTYNYCPNCGRRCI